MAVRESAPHGYEVLATEEVYSGQIISLRRDTVAMPGGGDSVREVVHHPGAVGIVALDDADRVVMLRQYRHPVRAHLWGAARQLFVHTIELGGTLSGEHGIGSLKRDWLAREAGPVGMRVHRAIKAALDPADILNPGKLF